MLTIGKAERGVHHALARRCEESLRERPVAAGVDNEETLAWVEHSLKRARHQEQARLTGLLEAVQAEVTFELKLLEAGRVSCGGLARSGAGLRRR